MHVIAPELRIGPSGWLYSRWRKVFYPDGLPQRRELAYVGDRFNSVELNGSFYSLQRPESYRRWYAETPEGFVFALKGGRFLTHMKKLSNVESALANFFAQGILLLGQKLGPILWQLPEQLKFDEGRMRDFLTMLPRDTAAAAGIAKQHDAWLEGRAHTEMASSKSRSLRHAFEVRHESYRSKTFFRMLADANAALVVADSAQRFPMFEEQGADFMYARLHGDVELYTSGYSAEALDVWAKRIRKWRRNGRDVYVYFDNDAKVHAPFDALALASRFRPPRRPAT